jgi:hypothetical protein
VDEKQKEGFRELEKSGYLKQVREFAMARCVPFFWSTQEHGHPPRLLHNGTICYVDTGQRQIGITNNHVYQQYIDDLANFPNVEAQFNGNTIRPETRLIDRNKDLDLATFDVPAVFVSSSTRNLQHHKPAGWPPPPVRAGDLVRMVVIPASSRRSRQGEPILRSNRSFGGPPISLTRTSSCTLIFRIFSGRDTKRRKSTKSSAG